MKKTLKNLGALLAVILLIVVGCQDDDKTFGDLTAPTNLAFTYDVVGQSAEFPNGDGTGKVVLRATADNAISYKFLIDGEDVGVAAGGVKPYTVTRQGVNTYEVTIIAYGKGGVASTATFSMENILLNFEDPDTFDALTGTSSKVWYIAAAEQGHLGVGPNTPDGNNNWPAWYAAAPFEKAGSDVSSCFYNNKFTFTNDNGVIRFEHDNGGATFFNAGYTSVGGTPLGEDTCLPYDVTGTKTVTLGAASSVVAPANSTGTQFTISGGGFLGYYIGTSTYEVLNITATRMQLRAVQGNNSDLAWYLILTTQPPYPDDEPEYNTLIWEDQFNYTGAPDASKWTMEIGNNNGWGNNEAQYYRAENANVSGGTLKITAKKETFNGFQYTSSRMKTQDKFEFTYGRVVMKAKLPAGGGTWPALWMLGANYDQPGQGWPACGEIDMMEHVGNQQDVIHGTLHYPGNSAGNANTSSTNVPGVSTDFHIYSITWSPSFIRFFVDGNEFKTFPNSASVPFNHDFFIIFNIAMGGNMGGAISPTFTQSAMEVDYIEVYQ
ncbi:glycoside hydrolase family 16 protein [Flavobacterium sp. MFBS3-15]|uniref:glycoside hydrolase family 16 protein n=1 Tax=Flavobacterium sp. MFBS3-15 TaxID=2989816 RepID=UPI002235C832|nr:glycoside hydrolase family 16 protein [Flavobacterium sp. MFBS3-15]MCW4468528.1 glycoside hydrolase family 16 protein [Flavobacterium sp. MFBS3-15]